jgi:hypothetical protein
MQREKLYNLYNTASFTVVVFVLKMIIFIGTHVVNYPNGENRFIIVNYFRQFDFAQF